MSFSASGGVGVENEPGACRVGAKIATDKTPPLYALFSEKIRRSRGAGLVKRDQEQHEIARFLCPQRRRRPPL